MAKDFEQRFPGIMVTVTTGFSNVLNRKIDDQLTAIRGTNGMVGVNYAVSFLRADGRQDSDTPVELIVDHVEHFLKKVGEDSVGFGSDFDGATMPLGMEDASKLPKITDALLKKGYSEADIEKILGGNILRVMEAVEKMKGS